MEWKKLNKFERRFVIADMFIVAMFYSYLVATLWSLIPSMITVGIALVLYYHLRLRGQIWNNLERQEQNWKFNLPKDWKAELENPIECIKESRTIYGSGRRW